MFKVQRMWMIKGLPVSWGLSEAKTALAGSFSDLTMVSTKRDKAGKCFFFKGIYDQGAQRDIAPISISVDGSDYTLWAEWAPPRPQKTVQRRLPGGAVAFVRAPELLQSTAVKQEAGTIVDDAGKSVPDPKKPRQEDKVRVVPTGLIYKTVPKDGNCVFHSLAAGLKFVTNGKVDLTARELRARTVEHFKKHEDTYAKKYDGP